VASPPPRPRVAAAGANIRSRTVRRLEGYMGVGLVEWLGLLCRAGVLIAVVGFGLATLGLLHP
jgi:hypothetical protein